eukprot:TRINITY_DN25538_c0_g1_i2.p1 TRINITY_DN25538_c0_g1~~TRINITY_DN25538_c0_g1_i2.p1  ORF type:complete len:858 (-),score=114.89 TRINITY_DN25538_c0_g1_i2:200-2773(-)
MPTKCVCCLGMAHQSGALKAAEAAREAAAAAARICAERRSDTLGDRHQGSASSCGSCCREDGSGGNGDNQSCSGCPRSGPPDLRGGSSCRPSLGSRMLPTPPPAAGGVCKSQVDPSVPAPSSTRRSTPLPPPPPACAAFASASSFSAADSAAAGPLPRSRTWASAVHRTGEIRSGGGTNVPIGSRYCSSASSIAPTSGISRSVPRRCGNGDAAVPMVSARGPSGPAQAGVGRPPSRPRGRTSGADCELSRIGSTFVDLLSLAGETPRSGVATSTAQRHRADRSSVSRSPSRTESPLPRRSDHRKHQLSVPCLRRCDRSRDTPVASKPAETRGGRYRFGSGTNDIHTVTELLATEKGRQSDFMSSSAVFAESSSDGASSAADSHATRSQSQSQRFPEESGVTVSEHGMPSRVTQRRTASPHTCTVGTRSWSLATAFELPEPPETRAGDVGAASSLTRLAPAATNQALEELAVPYLVLVPADPSVWRPQRQQAVALFGSSLGMKMDAAGMPAADLQQRRLAHVAAVPPTPTGSLGEPVNESVVHEASALSARPLVAAISPGSLSTFSRPPSPPLADPPTPNFASGRCQPCISSSANGDRSSRTSSTRSRSITGAVSQPLLRPRADPKRLSLQFDCLPQPPLQDDEASSAETSSQCDARADLPMLLGSRMPAASLGHKCSAAEGAATPLIKADSTSADGGTLSLRSRLRLTTPPRPSAESSVASVGTCATSVSSSASTNETAHGFHGLPYQAKKGDEPLLPLDCEPREGLQGVPCIDGVTAMETERKLRQVLKRFKRIPAGRPAKDAKKVGADVTVDFVREAEDDGGHGKHATKADFADYRKVLRQAFLPKSRCPGSGCS